jgi:hypothetical protein
MNPWVARCVIAFVGTGGVAWMGHKVIKEDPEWWHHVRPKFRQEPSGLLPTSTPYGQGSRTDQLLRSTPNQSAFGRDNSKSPDAFKYLLQQPPPTGLPRPSPKYHLKDLLQQSQQSPSVLDLKKPEPSP